MNCIYCNRPAGFLKMYHADCHQKVQQRVAQTKSNINSTIASYKAGTLNATATKNRIFELINNEPLYTRHLSNSIMQSSQAIKPKEINVFLEDSISVVQYKNHCTMTRTGLSYRRYPVWKEQYRLLSSSADLLLTNKALYIFLDTQSPLRFPYTKVKDLSYATKTATLTLDIKTTSETPHQIHLTASNKKDISKTQNLYYFLKCLR